MHPDPETQAGLAHILVDTRFSSMLETGEVYAMAFAPDGHTLATAGGTRRCCCGTSPTRSGRAGSATR